MPEVPEIRYLREYIKKIKGRRLIGITTLGRKIKLPETKLTVKNIGSVGKLLFLDCGDYVVHLRMGLTGWVSFEELDYTKYILEFNGVKLYVDDRRKFSSVNVYDLEKHERVLESLGVDLFSKEYTYDYFHKNMKKVNKIIVAFLMDQSVNAGIGNYIKNESLYLSGINPKRKTNTLEEKEISKLYKAIRFVAYSNLIEVLKENKIRIPSEIEKLKPKKLEVPYKFYVYRQKEDPYGNKVTREFIGGRGTYFVSKLQK